MQDQLSCRQEFVKLQAPASLYLLLTSRCNLRCSYCIHFNSSSNTQRDLPAEEWFKLLDEAAAQKVLNVVFSGGEVFMRPDIFDILRKCAGSRMVYSIFSNAGLISDEYAARLAEIGRCTAVQVSLDGVGEIHDSARGKGSFDAAVRGIGNLRNHGINVRVMMTQSHHNVGHLEETADFVFNELKLNRMMTNSAIVIEDNPTDPKELELGFTEYAEVMHEHILVGKKYPGLIATDPMLSMWRKILKCRRDNRPMLFGGFHAACIPVYNMLAVRADGAFLACNCYPDRVLGRINRDSIVDIWQKSRFRRDLCSFRHKPLSDYEYCRDCEFRQWCTGACPAVALQHNDGAQPSCAATLCLKKFLEACPDFNFELDN